MQLLKGHISPETAFVVADYPYGFRLRCKIRYWIEYHKTRGFRFASQTTNPKRPGEVWNAPKYSTYSRFGAAMFIEDETGHVKWSGLSEYSDGAEAKAWAERFGEAVPEAGRKTLDAWVAAKVAYDAARAARKAEGEIPPLIVGLVEARQAVRALSVKDRIQRAVTGFQIPMTRLCALYAQLEKAIADGATDEQLPQVVADFLK